MRLTHRTTVISTGQLRPGDDVRLGPHFATTLAAAPERDAAGGGWTLTLADAFFDREEPCDGGGGSGGALPRSSSSSPSSPSGASKAVFCKDRKKVEALASHAFHSTDVDAMRAESYFILGRLEHARGENEKALQYYAEACRLWPDFALAQFRLAQVRSRSVSIGLDRSRSILIDRSRSVSVGLDRSRSILIDRSRSVSVGLDRSRSILIDRSIDLGRSRSVSIDLDRS